jgi:UDP-N-acetylmuramyl pentapeptide phosphotransferase/UDP-N-acetylglucosamine-1-phosphate transferase
MLIPSAIVILVAFAVAWFATKLSIPVLIKRGSLDHPNHRSSHRIPTPRGGGIGIIAGIVAGLFTGWLLNIPWVSWQLLVGAGIMAVIGFVDDQFGGLPASIRFAVQLLAAGIVVYNTGGLASLPLPPPFNVPLGHLAIPIAVVWLLAVTNIYNFLDGIDGFAALQGVIGGFAIALLGEKVFISVGLSIAGACIGFALHNWHPAKVFMGDVASGTLGFLLAALPFQIRPDSRGTAILATVICLWFFLADGTFTIFRRVARGERIWTAHRSHLYQRLVSTGLRHDQVVLKVTAGSLMLAILAVICAHSGQALAWWASTAAGVVAFVTYHHWTRYRESTNGLSKSTDA